jgi:hypothetical protein
MSRLRLLRIASVAGLLASAFLVMPAAASFVPGGRNPRTDCYARYQVGDGTDVLSTRVVTCTDGDPSCDRNPGEGCAFRVALCINQTDNQPTCIPPGPAAALKKVRPMGKARKLGLQPPADLASSACGVSVDVPVSLRRKGRRPGKVTLKSIAISPVKPKRDRDVVKLVCTPGTTTPTLTCPANPAGGPDQLDLTTADTGTDLDNGWTGVAHNFPVDPRATLKLCLAGCDAGTNPVCDASGPTGAGSLNGETFGPPLPLITQSVPVCVVNRYQPGPVTGRVNVQTGEVSPDQPLQVNLLSDVHFTFSEAICPRCTGPNAQDYGGTGTCDGGQNPGRACTVDSILTVPLADGDKTYRLSKSCPPSSSQSVGMLNIRLPLTTGTSRLAGSRPCRAQPGDPSQGINVQDDACGGSPCAAECTGPACLTRDAEGRCIDAKGGVSQVCCNSNTTTPCFPTANDGAIERTGRAAPPRDGNGLVWPEGTYPKTTADGVLAATFCEAATTASVVNSTTGLPGPGALLLPGTQTLIDDR